MLNLFSSHLISSHRSFSWKLFTASHCHRSLCHPISSHHLNSSQLIRCLLGFFHLISSNPISCLLLSQLFSADRNCSHRFSCHLSFLISSHLTSAYLSFLRFSQLVSTLLSSPQPLSAHLVPSHLLSPPLTSSKLLSHLLSWSQILSARITAPQLFSAHSQTISPFLSPKTCCKKGSQSQSKQSYAFNREDFMKIFLHSHSTLLHREFWTHRSFYTELGKLFFTAKLSHT